jgi:hypothetical protein
MLPTFWGSKLRNKGVRQNRNEGVKPTGIYTFLERRVVQKESMHESEALEAIVAILP